MIQHLHTVHTLTATQLGDLLLAATPQGLSGAWFTEGQRGVPAWHNWGAPTHGHSLLGQAAREVAEYFAGQRQRFDVPLDLSSGTAFQQSVWRALLDIAAGDSQSYGQVAARIGHPAAVRAVGTAVGANPISVIVPCHRVLGSTGTLAGYGGGLGRKVALLRREGWQVNAPAGAEPASTLRPQRVVVRR
ncbi:methylated-DNA--[protein]-cysteine S-methyltransferase [Ottowia sp. SB7-C50]|uniref:methylated-DNA--[protein]-cysteine S-methyltransferase n=1 Tax=Ottowia sp. SB7-C50 TaxID=3081231 RepID=UPI0029547B23|nr:methylated-DNA--[protein]-cysteine S-methyltransferase [Ottowia sp. SB7-C50]WOP14645.1 methylated-DNA--[protein]-cysteine S-methyltransferase [Ottowia sp. SB7-C50]